MYDKLCASRKSITLSMLLSSGLTVIFFLYFFGIRINSIHVHILRGFIKVHGAERWNASFSEDANYISQMHQSVCKIPKLDPWDPSIRKYFGTGEENITCEQLQKHCTNLDNDGWLKVTCSDIHCRFRCFDRKPGADDFSNIFYGPWTGFRGRIKVECEFTEVKCDHKSSGNNVYSNLYSQIIPKRQNAASSKKPSVILIVLDSVSHSSFRRDLPKSYQVLQTQLGAKVLNGHVKSGYNSFPNAVAFLTGKSQFDPELHYHKDMAFDEWPFIWKNFSDRGYVTYYSEDYPRWHLFSHLSLKGFRNKPVDHYARPFYLKVIRSKLKQGLCFGNETVFNMGLRYLKQFIVNYGPDRPKFALHWVVDAAHRDPRSLSAHDGILADFFNSLQPFLRKTILFVFSDHGHQFYKIRGTLVGRIEDRMPFFSVALPQDLQNKDRIAKALDANSNVLTSHYDLYMTLCDILLSAEVDDVRKYGGENLWRSIRTRGWSLFRPIPPRNCETAGIFEDDCICQQQVNVNVNHSGVVQGANQIVTHVNALLNSSLGKCAKLTLRQLVYASIVHPNDGLIRSFLNMKTTAVNLHFLVIVTVVVDPSGGMFEGTLKYLTDSKNKLEDLTVVGTVQRINAYGNQSHCVDSMALRPYCYCL